LGLGTPPLKKREKKILFSFVTGSDIFVITAALWTAAFGGYFGQVNGQLRHFSMQALMLTC